jgi:hypothetical protein
MMDAGGRASEDQVLDLLKDALRERDVPDEVIRAAKESWTWRTIDAELAALTYDSAVDTDALAGVRGVGTIRSLTFGTAELLVEIELEPAGGEDDGPSRLVGQMSPAGPATVTVERVDGRPGLELAVDELGRFRAERVSPGVVRLRIDRAGAPLVTDWFAI